MFCFKRCCQSWWLMATIWPNLHIRNSNSNQ
jgi:hypothetical protein